MAFLEILLTIIATVVIGGIVTFKYNYNSLFAENVSKHRMDWINNFREEMSVIISAIQGGCRYNDTSSMKNAYKARAKLRTRLNQDISRFGNEYNQILDEMLRDLTFCQKDNEKVETLIYLSRKILEPEWQKVKREARGKK
ncbi:MAG: hypothetical protein IJF14_02330 [Clostridia bacterium]|nr:hypothetical protein [Clostridia bacterium]